MKKILLLILVVVLSLSCGKEKNDNTQQVKSPEEILSEKGFPVKIKEITGQTIAKELSYTGVLEGSRQSRATSNLADELTKVHVKVGDYVKKDQVIAEFDEDSPAAQFIQAKSAYEIAEKTYNRMKNLFDVGGISQQQLDEVETHKDVAKANMEGAQKAITILAPINGVVTELLFQTGDNVGPGDAVAVISDFSTLKTTINVSENDIQDFYVGLPVDVIWKALSDSTFKGKITKVSLSADPETRSFEVEIAIPNPKRLLKPGTIATINVMANEVKNAIAIPKLILREFGGKNYVFVVENGNAIKRFVKTGIETGIMVQVMEGLNLGEKLVVEGQRTITDNVKVNIID